MTKKLNVVFLLCLNCIFLLSCNKDGMDTTELWENSQASGDIIERSGTVLSTGTPEKRKLALQDAENRLRTGGGLFGQKGGIDLLNTEKEKTTITSMGMPINPYLWRGSLETIEFMPLVSADPFAGIIITDWYAGLNNPNERCKINIFIKGSEMKTSNLKVNSFCQILVDGNWLDQQINQKNNADLENAILNKAKKIRLSQS